MARDHSQQARLRGRRCLCRACGHLFGSLSAFDRHQTDDGSSAPCLDVAEFTAPTGKAQRPRLTWHPGRQLWVTKLDERYRGQEPA